MQILLLNWCFLENSKTMIVSDVDKKKIIAKQNLLGILTYL